jgi:hypothetical protein
VSPFRRVFLISVHAIASLTGVCDDGSLCKTRRGAPPHYRDNRQLTGTLTELHSFFNRGEVGLFHFG